MLGATRIWGLARRAREDDLSELDPFVYAASEWKDRPENSAVFVPGVIAAAEGLLRI